MKPRRRLPELARMRRQRIPAEPWLPTPEEAAAIAAGDLLVFPILGGPVIKIDLSAASLKPKP